MVHLQREEFTNIRGTSLTFCNLAINSLQSPSEEPTRLCRGKSEGSPWFCPHRVDFLLKAGRKQAEMKSLRMMTHASKERARCWGREKKGRHTYNPYEGQDPQNNKQLSTKNAGVGSPGKARGGHRMRLEKYAEIRYVQAH